MCFCVTEVEVQLMFWMFIGGASLNLVITNLNLCIDHCFFLGQ